MQRRMIYLPAKTEKLNVLHSFKTCNVKNEQVANLIDCNVQLHVLSHKPDNFQGVTKMVFNRLQKLSKVCIVTDIVIVGNLDLI